MPTADEFRIELFKMMHEAVKQHSPHVDINAGELHRRLGDYPGSNHRMPACCEVMKRVMAEMQETEFWSSPRAGKVRV